MVSAISNRAKELLAEVRKTGIKITIENDFVIFSPPPSIEIQMQIAAIGDKKIKKELAREAISKN